MKKRINIGLCCVLVFWLAASGCAKQASSFRFSLTGDPRSGLSRWRHTLQQMKARADGEFAFHIAAGDYFEEDRSTVAADFYRTFKEEFGDEAVWYPTVGNHELKGQATDLAWLQQFYHDHLAGKVNPGPKGCEETTYSWDYGIAHFVQLDMYYDGSRYSTHGTFSDILYDWLVEDLDRNSKPVVFVIYHEPAFPNERGGKDSPPGWKRFMKLLNERKVVAGLCAHTHCYARYQVKGGWEPFTWEVDCGNAGRLSHADKHQTFVDIKVGSDGLVEFNTWQGLEGEEFKNTDSWSVRSPVGEPVVTKR